MRWTYSPPKDPAADRGKRRTVLRFAWLPTVVDQDDDKPLTVWLERYWEVQEWGYGRDGYGGCYGWLVAARYSRDPLIEEALRQSAEAST